MMCVILMMAGCASNHYEKAANDFDTRISGFRQYADPIMNAIVDGSVQPVDGFEKISAAARAAYPDDAEFQNIWVYAIKNFSLAQQGQMTGDQAGGILAEHIRNWSNRKQAELDAAARLDSEEKERWSTIGMYLGVAAQSVSNSATNGYYQNQYVQPQYNSAAPLMYINPYMKSDGTFVNGHLRTAPNYTCLDNLNGCR